MSTLAFCFPPRRKVGKDLFFAQPALAKLAIVLRAQIEELLDRDASRL